MEYISSDTNIWIDFDIVDGLNLPFRLEVCYVMSRDAIEDEWRSPRMRNARLTELGLQIVEIDEEEFYYAVDIKERYPRLSQYDAFALAIAKKRGMILLTGDRRLRMAANDEQVQCRGTLWVFDQLFEKKHITKEEYVSYMQKLKEHNGREIRLPLDEIEKRING